MTREPVKRETPLTGKVETLAGYGLSAAEIALVLDVDLEALKTGYSRELESAAIKANVRVAESLFRKATGEGRESVVAAIFWLKTRARWKEVSVHEHAGVPEAPVKFEVTFVDSEKH